jgi:hypothetical protein
MARRSNKAVVTTAVATSVEEQPLVTVETLAQAVQVGKLRILTNTDWKGSVVQVEAADIYQNRPYALVTLLTDTRGKLRKPELQRSVKVRPESLGEVLQTTLDQLVTDMNQALETEMATPEVQETEIVETVETVDSE